MFFGPSSRAALCATARRPNFALANLQPDQLMRPESVAEAYWDLYRQPRDAWTFEHEIRPYGEKW